VPSQSRSTTSQAARKPAGSVGHQGSLGVAPVELVVDQRSDVDPVDRDLPDLPVDVDVDQLDTAHHDVVPVDGAERGAVQVGHADLGPAQVHHLEPGAGQVDLPEPGARQVCVDEVSHT
jgi:hypothetical protein